MKQCLELQPTVNQTFRVVGTGARGNLAARLEQSYKAEQSGDYESACAMRYEAFETSRKISICKLHSSSERL